jgi:hypothetical protein
MERNDIRASIEDKQKLIEQLKKEIVELRKQDYLFSDEKQWYKEEDTIVYYYDSGDRRKKPREESKKLGYVYWNETFIEEDTNETVEIERKQLVTVNGDFEFEYDFYTIKI